MFEIALVVGPLFAPLGGLIAATITYIEYAKHQLPRGRAIAEAVRSDVVATLVPFALTRAFGRLMARD